MIVSKGYTCPKCGWRGSEPPFHSPLIGDEYMRCPSGCLAANGEPQEVTPVLARYEVDLPKNSNIVSVTVDALNPDHALRVVQTLFASTRLKDTIANSKRLKAREVADEEPATVSAPAPAPTPAPVLTPVPPVEATPRRGGRGNTGHQQQLLIDGGNTDDIQKNTGANHPASGTGDATAV